MEDCRHASMRGEPARSPRLHVERGLHAGARLELPDASAHHAARVLRLGAGDALTLFDGSGGEYDARIVAIERTRVSVAVGTHHARERESPFAITLVQALSSSEKMDFIIQKAVELGVAAIQPVLTAKSVVRLSAERGAAKLEHWRRVIISACEQCGRNRVPEVRAAITLQTYCARPDAALLRMLLSPRGEKRLAELAPGAGRSVVLAAGPEAGFAPGDETLLVNTGFVSVRLGPRVLRAETAALAALAALNALAWDF